MSVYDVAIVGVGTGRESASGTAQADREQRSATQLAGAYEKRDDCRLVAAAGGGRERAAAFARAHGLPDDAAFGDSRRLLGAVEPDVLAVCTPPATRAETVLEAVDAGGLAAIHCQQPMATTWSDASAMATACREAGVALAVFHPYRFTDPIRDAKALLDDGAVGPLTRVEHRWGSFADVGTAAVDLCHYFEDDQPVEWVLAQTDANAPGDPAGSHLLSTWRYADGVRGLATAGETGDGADLRLVGEDGFIDVDIADEPAIRVRGANGNPDKRYEAPARDASLVDRAVADVVDALPGRRSELRAANALAAAEVVFAGHESVRRRGRVDLPLEGATERRVAGNDDGRHSPQPGDG